MTRERIEDIREILLPFVKKQLLKINYENLGKSDVEEFEKDFNEILDLATKAIEQEPTERIDVLKFIADNAGLSLPEAIELAYLRGYNNAKMSKPTTKSDLAVDWENYKDVDGNSLDDLILDILKDYFDCGNTYGYEVADKIIELLPSVTPQEPRWIPVSERLPKDRREVLVTAYWHETYQIMMASYFGDGLWWCVPFNNCGKHMQELTPIAWMPLPEPYKESEVEKENV